MGCLTLKRLAIAVLIVDMVFPVAGAAQDATRTRLSRADLLGVWCLDDCAKAEVTVSALGAGVALTARLPTPPGALAGGFMAVLDLTIGVLGSSRVWAVSRTACDPGASVFAGSRHGVRRTLIESAELPHLLGRIEQPIHEELNRPSLSLVASGSTRQLTFDPGCGARAVVGLRKQRDL